MASSMRTDKEVFFRRLDELDELAWETDGEATSEHALKVRRLCSFNTLHCEHTSREQKISNSEVRPTPSTITELGPNAPLSEVIIMPAQSSNRRAVSAKPPPKLSKKQSSKKSIQLQREGAQIFRGLVFCEFIMSLVTHHKYLTNPRLSSQQRYCCTTQEAYREGSRVWSSLG